MEKEQKIILFTHGNDIDGIGCLILADLAFDDPSYALVSNITELETKFEEALNRPKPSDLYSYRNDDTKISCRLDSYDRIYVTDLCFHKEFFERLKEEPEIASRIKVFDHHATSIKEGCLEYPNVNIIENSDGKKRCATDIFYEYLIQQGLLKRTRVLDKFVELTRLEDTWDWKKAGPSGKEAHDLAILFNACNSNNYRKNIMQALKRTTEVLEIQEEKIDASNLSPKEKELKKSKIVVKLILSKDDKKVIEQKKKEDMACMQKLWNEAEIFTDEENNTFAAVFADYEYRNELAEYVQNLIEQGKQEEAIRYLVVVALEKGQFGQKSYRAIEEGFNVGKVAESHGGGGHEAAASVNITEEQREHALTLKRRSGLDYLVNSDYKC